MHALNGEVLFVVGLVMVVGLIGVAIPVLPGLFLILGAGLWWVLDDGPSTTHWVIFALMAAVLVAATVAKYLVPARKTAAAGASGRSMLFAVALGIVGFFAIPIVGAPIGFVVGIYASERVRHLQHAAAWNATKAALKGVGLSMLIEFTGGAIMIAIWIVGLILTR